MRSIGIWITAFGVLWFALSWLAVFVQVAIEEFTGETPGLPRFDRIEWMRILIYFGVYLGSWLVMFVGALIRALESIIRRRERVGAKH